MKQTSDIAFASDWLALREPADHAARDRALLKKAAAAVATGATILDLGSGTGSTIRAFENADHHAFGWRLFDNDADLLGLAIERHPGAEGLLGNLGDVGRIPLDGVGLVTASALLDLMSLDWIEALAERLRAAQLPFYAALNYDGVMHWTPSNSDDAIITRHFNTHQQRDKGTGTALGPRSVPEAARLFTQLGFEVSLGISPWRIGSDQAALQLQLLDGIADAVAEIDQSAAPQWRSTRKAAVSNAQAYVGHLDILAIPIQSNT